MAGQIKAVDEACLKQLDHGLIFIYGSMYLLAARLTNRKRLSRDNVSLSIGVTAKHTNDGKRLCCRHLRISKFSSLSIKPPRPLVLGQQAQEPPV